MKEKTLIIKDVVNFEPKDIFECGQCFRWNKQEDNSYIGIVGNNVLEVSKKENNLFFQGIIEEDITKIVKQYFDLDTDYQKIQERLCNIDEYLEQSISYAKGIRILNQDLWETLISFIISANNNIPRIKGIIERLAKNYGKPIHYKGKNYYTFPTPQELSKASIQDLRAIGLGFRDKRIQQTTQKVLTGEINLQDLKQKKDTKEIRNELLKIPGVGPKVADCILLFALQKKEVFPIDVWVRRVMNELYLKQEDENKMKQQEILEFAQKKYGDLAGIAQQYLFYWRRSNKGG